MMSTINDSVPRYVRCIKPNSIASAKAADLDEAAVKEQLRAGSILEAVRIRKVGYGYRMEYDDFGDKFWPILGGRIYETDLAVIKRIFEKASAIVDEGQKECLASGPNQGW